MNFISCQLALALLKIPPGTMTVILATISLGNLTLALEFRPVIGLLFPWAQRCSELFLCVFSRSHQGILVSWAIGPSLSYHQESSAGELCRVRGDRLS